MLDSILNCAGFRILALGFMWTPVCSQGLGLWSHGGFLLRVHTRPAPHRLRRAHFSLGSCHVPARYLDPSNRFGGAFGATASDQYVLFDPDC